MIFHATDIAGAVVIETERHADARGHFARTWCRDEFAAHGIDAGFVQCGTSYNRRRGTLRGLHYQRLPHAEAKLIRCTRGAVYDVALDLRPGSPSRGRWTATELSAANGHMVFLPEGIAHGFQALADDTELFYQISAPYVPAAAAGVGWDDPSLAIPWPVADPILSERDRALPPLSAVLEPELGPCS